MEPIKETCPLCHGRGLIILNENTATPCKCTIQKNVRQKFKNALMSKELFNCHFSKFNTSYYSKNLRDAINGKSYYENAAAIFKAAQNFVGDVIDNPNADGILITGPVGSGKTFLAGAVANALLENDKEVLFIVVPDLLDQIKATYNNNYEYTEHELMDAARKVGILILDDMGAHNYTDWTRNKLYTILNYRMNNRLPTLITTNLDLNELEEYLGERTTSRIIQMCKTYRLLVETDIRIVKRQEQDRTNY